MGKKHAKYKCSICFEETNNQKKFIDHYKEEHREQGHSLYDSIGTTGDAFVDTAIMHYRNKFVNLERENKKLVDEYSKLETRYREVVEKTNVLIFKYGKAISTISVISELIRTTKDTVNTELSLKHGEGGVPIVR